VIAFGYQLKGCMQEHPLDFSAIFESAQNQLNPGMWASFHPRNIALKFFCWVAFRSREIMYAKKAHRLEKASGLLHTQYLENEANFSAKTTGHCLTYLNEKACEIWSVFDKVHL